MKLDLQTVQNAVSGRAAAFRCVTDYQPAGGPGDKVFPPTYEGGKYATEERIHPETGEVRPCVLLDSVQSQANRMELGLLEAHREDKVRLPMLVARFDQDELLKKFTVTSLEAPHRIADALFRDSLLNGKTFDKSDKGSVLNSMSVGNATELFGLCPTGLIFGLWYSTGPRGGQGAKFQRAIVSEVIGYDAIQGKKTSSRIDPAGIEKVATLYERSEASDSKPAWTLDDASAVMVGRGNRRGPKKWKGDGAPSEANHGNILPTIADGGFTISKARQTTVLSLSALRRLRFPLNGSVDSDQEVDIAARTALAALGLAAGSLARTDGDLRSRCHLFADNEPVWELLDRPGKTPETFELDPDDALKLLAEAISDARSKGLPWEGEIELTPSSELVELVKRSQELATASSEGE